MLDTLCGMSGRQSHIVTPPPCSLAFWVLVWDAACLETWTVAGVSQASLNSCLNVQSVELTRSFKFNIIRSVIHSIWVENPPVQFVRSWKVFLNRLTDIHLIEHLQNVYKDGSLLFLVFITDKQDFCLERNTHCGFYLEEEPHFTVFHCLTSLYSNLCSM